LAYRNNLQKKAVAHQNLLNADNLAARKVRLAMVAKETKVKNFHQEKLNKKMERYHKGLFPGANKVRRMEARQDRQARQIGKIAARVMTHQMTVAKKNQHKMLRSSAQALTDVGQGAVNALHAEQTVMEHSKPANTLVADAWGYAMGGTPTKAEQEALTIARPEGRHLGRMRDTSLPPDELLHAWGKAVGTSASQTKHTPKQPARQTKRAFLEALGLDDETSAVNAHARDTLQDAWRVALGPGRRHAVSAEQLAAAVTGFHLTKDNPPHQYPMKDGARPAGPADEMEVAEAVEQGSRPEESLAAHLHQLEQVTTQTSRTPPPKGADPEQAAEDAVDRILKREAAVKAKMAAQAAKVKAAVEAAKVRKAAATRRQASPAGEHKSPLMVGEAAAVDTKATVHEMSQMAVSLPVLEEPHVHMAKHAQLAGSKTKLETKNNAASNTHVQTSTALLCFGWALLQLGMAL